MLVPPNCTSFSCAAYAIKLATEILLNSSPKTVFDNVTCGSETDYLLRFSSRQNLRAEILGFENAALFLGLKEHLGFSGVTDSEMQ